MFEIEIHAVQAPLVVERYPMDPLHLITHRPQIHVVKTAAAAAVSLSFLFTPGSVILPLLEVVVLEDDEEVFDLAAESMAKCNLESS